MLIKIPASFGELVDKLTILRIKESRLEGEARDNVVKELQELQKSVKENGLKLDESELLELQRINQMLWDIEDAIRAKEAQQTFDADFIELARSVYKWNDKRAALKRSFSKRYGSELIEEKRYPTY